MRGTRSRSKVKSVAAVLCAACFLAASLGTVTRAAAADTFETWPRKTTEPGVQPKPEADVAGAETAGSEGGIKAATGLSFGTVGWIAVGAAAVIGIAIAAGGGGGGGGGGTTSNH